MDQDQNRLKSVPIRIPTSTRSQASQLAMLHGVSLNAFIGSAISEKIGRMEGRQPAEPHHGGSSRGPQRSFHPDAA